MIGRIRAWFAEKGWEPFPFQEETWEAYRRGESGLVHAPTGMGKSYAVWMGPLAEGLRERPERPAGGVAAKRTKQAARDRAEAEPLRVLWITPLRALATDTAGALQEAIDGVGLGGRGGWTVETRTGDTAAAVKLRQRERLPTCLVTTPESLSVMLSYEESRERLSGLKCVVVDEWHELLGTKRGAQTELGLARLRRWSPGLRVWGLSATVGNLDDALRVLLGGVPGGPGTEGWTPSPGRLIKGLTAKRVEIATLLPEDMERFPWSGHIGLRLLPAVLDEIAAGGSTLLFTNTRAQAEIWFQAIAQARPEWMADEGGIALHHGSLDRDVRARVEDMLRSGAVRCVVCTSSLDLGVDFSPVDRVIQIGSPKGVARLMQRAGRSGHRPGAVSRVLCVPTHAWELIEFAAARDAAARRDIESRRPLDRPLDLLAQHLVTLAMGGGFVEEELYDEVRTAHAFRALTREEWGWAMDFVLRGGPALKAYPQYARVTRQTDGGGVARIRVAGPKIAQLHRMGIGTISSDAAMAVRMSGGRSLGTVEESFASRLAPGDKFVFAGRVLELVRVRDMAAWVRPARNRSGVIPRWGGGKMPLSTQLAGAVRAKLDDARRGVFEGPEMATARPLIEIQQRWSRLPGPDELLIERVRTGDGHHVFVYPFDGRLVHEGLAALVASRLAARRPVTVNVTANDYGFELLSGDPIEADEETWRWLLSADRLVEDLLACLNATQLARRRFRDIARVAGLILPGYPGEGRPVRHLQASSELFFDVFSDFDPGNMLLDQARREVLEEQLEVRRLKTTLDRIAGLRIVTEEPERLTPLAFPLWTEGLRQEQVSSETWSDRVSKMVVTLEEAASTEAPRGRSTDGRRRERAVRAGKRTGKRAGGPGDG